MRSNSRHAAPAVYFIGHAACIPISGFPTPFFTVRKMIKQFSLSLILLLFVQQMRAQPEFVKAGASGFSVDGKPYAFIGANYWYGALLGLEKDPQRGLLRLREELDFLKSTGVNNLRVLVGAEGQGQINGVTRVAPVLQPSAGTFNGDILKGLDLLLAEMHQRKMYAVLFLSNNWEWSGGFLQYLNWAGKINADTLKRKLSWDEQRDYTSQFYSCEPCIANYRKQVAYILAHKSSVTGKTYAEEPAIMAWELANEPRPMRAAAIPAYKKWIAESAALIKKTDPNHLITIGTEGTMGTDESAALYKDIHALPAIDYLTLHIWPKNWGWFKAEAIAESMVQIKDKSTAYIAQHEQIAKELHKPLVIEEFGLPRDGHSFSPEATTGYRDEFYKHIFGIFAKSRKEKGPISGLNFWAYGGHVQPHKGQVFWQQGDEFLGDPPQEEQGLNNVFNTDVSTWKLIYYFRSLIK